MSTDPREFEHPIDGTGGTVTPAAIEAAARALFDLTPAENLAYATIPRWVDLHEQDRIYYRRLATAALTAAYPLIAAQALRDAADALDLPGSTDVGYYSGYTDNGYNQALSDAEEWLTDRAAAIDPDVTP